MVSSRHQRILYRGRGREEGGRWFYRTLVSSRGRHRNPCEGRKDKRASFVARRVNGKRAGGVRGTFARTSAVDFYQETVAVAVAAEIRKFRGMSVFCPYDYVAAEVNPYPAWIVGREVNSVASGNSGVRVGGGTKAKERTSVVGRAR